MANNAFKNIGIEQVRDYWDSWPCNVRHSLKDTGTKEYFDEVEARKYFVEPHIPGFAEFSRWKGKKVLEIGCGIGTDTMNFARTGADVTAVDLSSDSLEIVRKRAKVFGLDNIRFYQSNAEELTSVVPMERYDLVYSFGVIHHTPHPHNVIEQIHRYMDSDSIFKIMVYHRNSWKVFGIMMSYGRGAFWKLDKLVARHSEAQTGCPVTYTYTKKSVEKLLKGFEIINTKVDHIFPYKISDYVQYRYKKEWHLCVTAKPE